MVKTREAKVERIADYIPEQKIDSGADKGKVLVLGWGSTYGAIRSAVEELLSQGLSVSHAHIRYVRPFPATWVKYSRILIRYWCLRSTTGSW